jgi:hypothetical protein
VRETWGDADGFYGRERDVPGVIAYRADRTARQFGIGGEPDRFREVPAYDRASWNWDSIEWRPSIFMPRWACRLVLGVTDIRVQRLQDISEEDAEAEGAGIDDEGDAPPRYYPCVACSGDPKGIASLCHPIGRGRPWRCVFANLWDAINGKRAPWESNPWVWCVSFLRVVP